ncbi:MAG: ChaN family lipoprotein [Flavobacterium sp.]
MRFLLSMFCVLVFTVQTFSQELKNFHWFDANGKKTTTEKLIKEALKAEVVLFGEYHNNPICHWLQLKLTQSLHAKTQLVLGAEMLEADNQKVLNDYLNGTINQKGLDTLARLWSNYKTDYKPLVDFAKEKQLPFVATNIPRRYASMVFKNDFASLDILAVEEKSWIAPLPIPFDIQLPGYQNMLQMMGGHAGEKMPKAQAIKDATMAHFILQNLPAKGVFLHFNGTYHSDNYEGISWYLQQYRKGTKILTIATVEQSQLKQLEKEHLKKADFILVIDQDMTKTY